MLAETLSGTPNIPSLERATWLRYLRSETPRNAMTSGICGPKNAYAVKTRATTGRAGPIARRDASSNTTISKMPITISRMGGFAARSRIPVHPTTKYNAQKDPSPASM